MIITLTMDEEIGRVLMDDLPYLVYTILVQTKKNIPDSY